MRFRKPNLRLGCTSNTILVAIPDTSLKAVLRMCSESLGAPKGQVSFPASLGRAAVMAGLLQLSFHPSLSLRPSKLVKIRSPRLSASLFRYAGSDHIWRRMQLGRKASIHRSAGDFCRCSCCVDICVRMFVFQLLLRRRFTEPTCLFTRGRCC